ncbi:MAG: FAD-dependent oxidoreductase [Oscillospiraceae bacterium]|nr:FAD-dependent oxidoreductase [Oscillospiraceae bacterium]
MLLINNIKLNITSSHNQAVERAIKLLNIPRSRISDIWVHKVSIDARKGDVKFVYSVAAKLVDPAKEEKFKNKHKDISVKPQPEIKFGRGDISMTSRPVICGFGPAGIFAALVLARMGFKPVVLEMGQEIDKRIETVKAFEEKGILNTASNIQFGEGGAGTFSDGKLTTRISDERCGFVMDTFIAHGAPQEIGKMAKPHIGTDLLVDVIKSIRNEIISLGGQIMFDTALTDIVVKNGAIAAVKTTAGEIATDNLILATGHSARELFFVLKDRGVDMGAKPFSVGVRIEHLQSEIDKGLYHDLAGHPALPKGEYQLSHTKGDRGVYTFCMCPGGQVVAAASEENTVVVNGMSRHARDGKNANSALVVSVEPKDFDDDFTKAIAFQRQLEKTAFELGGKNYKAPAQTVDRFLSGKPGINMKRVQPTYPLGVTEADFDKLFPSFITDNLRSALPVLDRKLPGFAAPDSMLTGVETRTSSPVRIFRGEDYQSNIKGLYPTGEGAGYAGGIMSAAVDGVRVAQYICEKYRPAY